MPTETAAPVLALEHVALRFPSTAGTVEILRDADLTVSPGERVAIVGPSGSGKSSLIAVAAGLERPTAGTIRLLGTDLATADEDRRALLRRDHVALVFQDFHLLPNMTAIENVAAPLEIAGNRDAETLARTTLARVGLAARALAAGPKLLFADEPTGNLDRATATRIETLMLDLVAETGAALVLVTHDPKLAARLDRSVEMRDGRLHPLA